MMGSRNKKIETVLQLDYCWRKEQDASAIYLETLGEHLSWQSDQSQPGVKFLIKFNLLMLSLKF